MQNQHIYTRKLISAHTHTHKVQQRPALPTVTLTWHVCKCKGHVTPPEVHPANLRMYLWWSLCPLYLHTCQVSYCRWSRSLLLCLCYVFQALINSHMCWRLEEGWKKVRLVVWCTCIYIMCSKRSIKMLTCKWPQSTELSGGHFSTWSFFILMQRYSPKGVPDEGNVSVRMVVAPGFKVIALENCLHFVCITGWQLYHRLPVVQYCCSLHSAACLTWRCCGLLSCCRRVSWWKVMVGNTIWWKTWLSSNKLW